MKGIQYLVDDSGDKTAVLIDLKKYNELWEDFYGSVLARDRAVEPRYPLDEVRESLQQGVDYTNER